MKGRGKSSFAKPSNRSSPYAGASALCSPAFAVVKPPINITRHEIHVGGRSKAPDCKVFVGHLPYSTTWQDLKDHFGQVGTVTYTKILMEKDKGQGKGRTANPEGFSKGMGIVEFSSAEEAQMAIAKLDGSVVKDRSISVEPWTSHDGPDPQKPSAPPRAFKGADKGKGASKGKGGGKKGSQNPSCKVFVGQLPYSTTWQDLKDHFSQAGTVTYTKIIMEENKGKGKKGRSANPEGFSKGMGIVEFSTPEEVHAAVTMLNGSRMGERTIVVDKWTAD